MCTDDADANFIDDSEVEQRMYTMEEYKRIIDKVRKHRDLEKRLAEFLDIHAEDISKKKKKILNQR